LFHGREGLSGADKGAHTAKLVMIGKAHAIERVLAQMIRREITGRAESVELIADEAILGILPPIAVGQRILAGSSRRKMEYSH
jgi:hypothetical protein